MTETPKYSIIKKHNEIEIRHYPAYIQAEVVIDEKQYKSAHETPDRDTGRVSVRMEQFACARAMRKLNPCKGSASSPKNTIFSLDGSYTTPPSL